VMRYHFDLMQMILHDKAQVAKAVNATVISLDEAPQGYKDFDSGLAKKFVLDPHGLIKASEPQQPSHAAVPSFGATTRGKPLGVDSASRRSTGEAAATQGRAVKAPGDSADNGGVNDAERRHPRNERAAKLAEVRAGLDSAQRHLLRSSSLSESTERHLEASAQHLNAGSRALVDAAALRSLRTGRRSPLKP
jgi:hypothetical protein